MKHTTLSRFASLAASAALALSLAACGSTSRSTYSAAVSNDTAALSSQDAGDYESYSAESAAAGESSSFSSDDLTSSMLDPSTVESSRKIVYNASVRMETTDYDTTRAALQEPVHLGRSARLVVGPSPGEKPPKVRLNPRRGNETPRL